MHLLDRSGFKPLYYKGSRIGTIPQNVETELIQIPTLFSITESKIELSTTNDNVACGSPTEISVKSNISDNESEAYNLTLNTYNNLNPNNNTCVFNNSVDPSNPAEPAVILACPGHIPDATGARTLIKK